MVMLMVIPYSSRVSANVSPDTGQEKCSFIAESIETWMPPFWLCVATDAL